MECHSAPGRTGARVPAIAGGAQKHAEPEETIPEEQMSRDAVHGKSPGRAAPETEGRWGPPGADGGGRAVSVVAEGSPWGQGGNYSAIRLAMITQSCENTGKKSRFYASKW